MIELDPLFSHVEPSGDCWLWTGYVNDRGYGRAVVGRRTFQAHRVVYETLVGPIPAGLTLDHLCRVRNCVNPDHLEPVTNRENVLRGIGPVARAARAKACPAGHPYDEANTGHKRLTGERFCRTCRVERSRDYYQRNAERMKAEQTRRHNARRALRVAALDTEGEGPERRTKPEPVEWWHR